MEGATLSPSSYQLMRRRASYMALGSLSPRSGVVATAFSCEHDPRHFLDACALCRRPLGRACDIFMYRGDTPFCSEECRQQQIDLDEAREEVEAACRRTSGTRRRSHRAREPAAPAAADVPSISARAVEERAGVRSIPARAAEAAVAG